MKKLLAALGILVLLLIVVAVAVPFLVPVDIYKDRIVAAVKAKTGRDLAINGPVKLSLVPELAVEARDVHFANPPGSSTPDMATLKSLEVGLKPWPLLHGAVEVDRFVLNEPVIDLEIDKQGRPNWAFGQAQKPAPAPAPSGAAPNQPAAPGGGYAPSEVRLDDVRLVKGRLVYLNQRTGRKEELDDVDMKLSLPGLDQPFKGEGGATWNGERVALSVTAERPRALETGEATPLTLAVDAKPLTFSFKGVTGGSGRLLAGNVDLATPSVRGLAKWAGTTIDMPGNGLGPLAIKGRIELASGRIAFTEAQLALDAIKAKGDLAVETGGARPHANGRLEVDMLDLNPYLPPEAASRPPAAPATPATPAPGSPAPSGAPAAPAPAGWSDAPINLAGLKLADADFDLGAGGIDYRKIVIGKSALAIRVKDGRLQADLTQLALYGGQGQARVTVDASGAVPAIDLDAKLAGVEAEPLLRDVMGLDRLSGKGDLAVAAAGQGKSQREIIAALGGKGSIAFKDGAFKGVNLGEIVRNPTSVIDAGSGAPQKTDFTELGGTFTIAKGILSNRDLVLKAPLLRLDGAGTVDLPQRTVDYRLEPKLAATSEGQGGRTDVGGITVPVLVKGPWDHLRYEPDLAGVQVKGKPLDVLKGGAGLPPGKPADILKKGLQDFLGGKR